MIFLSSMKVLEALLLGVCIALLWVTVAKIIKGAKIKAIRDESKSKEQAILEECVESVLSSK